MILMPDREKVIKGLEEAETMLIQAVDRGGEMAVMGAFKCLNRVTDALALLKEQEAVKPKSKTRHGSTTMVQHWCGNCMVMLHGKPKYCPNCGRKVKWE